MSQPTKVERSYGNPSLNLVGNTVWGRFLFCLYFVLSCSGENACAVVSEAATDIYSATTTPVQCVSRSIYLVSLLSCSPPPPKQRVVKVQRKRSELVHYCAADSLSVMADKPGHVCK